MTAIYRGAKLLLLLYADGISPKNNCLATQIHEMMYARAHKCSILDIALQYERTRIAIAPFLCEDNPMTRHKRDERDNDIEQDPRDVHRHALPQVMYHNTLLSPRS